jgi:hypothetical protein
MSDKERLRWFARSRVMLVLLFVPAVLIHLVQAAAGALPEALEEFGMAWRAVSR